MKTMLRVIGKASIAAVVATAVPGEYVLSGHLLGVAQAAAQSAQSITVRGNSRIESDAIRAYFMPGPGERLDNGKINEAIKNLYSTGLFKDVRVSRAGNGLVVSVVENNVINQVTFDGNKKVKDAVLVGEVQSKSRGPYSQAMVDADVQRIQEVYRRSGRNAVQVTPKTTPLPNGRMDLSFQIDEGKKTKIAKIEFVGNEAYSDGRLRDEMTTTQSNFLSWLKSSDVYDPDRMNADMELVRRFYLSKGYADFRVVSSDAQLDEAKNSYTITVTVEEGEKYSFGAVDMESSVPDVDASSLRRELKVSSRSTYNAEEVEKSVEAVSLELAKRGYAFAQVRPRASRNYDQRTIDIVFSVEEGARVYVERVNIRGNTRTRDYVIRREFEMAEGDAYNQALVDRAERRLKNLGFFKNVKISSEPGSSSDRVVVNVDVEDQPTGEFSVAGGYSTADGFIGEVGVAEKNFLGRGQYVKVGAQWGERTNGFDFSFTEPFFLGRRMSAGFDAYMKNRDETNYSSYEIETVGGGLRLGFPITEEFSFGVNYQIYQRDITIPVEYRDMDFTNGEASVALKQAEGDTLTSQLGYALVYNALDNINNPSNGWRAELRQDFAGVGGDVNFIRTTGDARYYHELPSEFVFMARAQGGHVASWGSEDLRIMDQFFKGPDLVRGFAPSGIGPRDLATANQDPLGGSVYLGGTFEIQFPIFGLPKEMGLRGALFADAGTVYDYSSPTTFDLNGDGVIGVGESVNVWDDDKIRSSVGASLLWNSPLGPLRFDYAYVLSEGQYDDKQAFRFSGGTKF
jgi:outer membrane protein insertion porin family